MIPRQAAIRVYNDQSEWRFDWTGFDGDDCFDNYRLTVTDMGAVQNFDFCAAAIWSLCWLNRFFKDPNLEKTRGGISIYRSGQDYKMTFDFEGRQEEFHLKSPKVQVDREFMPKYDGEDET